MTPEEAKLVAQDDILSIRVRIGHLIHDETCDDAEWQVKEAALRDEALQAAHKANDAGAKEEAETLFGLARDIW